MKKNKFDNDIEYSNSSYEDDAYDDSIEKEKRRKKKQRRRFWDRVAGFIIVTCLMVGCACLAFEYVIVKGPSPELRDLFVGTMNETRRFRFIPRIFLTNEELDSILNSVELASDLSTDESLITLHSSDDEVVVDEDGFDKYGLKDDDGDGLIMVDIKGPGFVGYMIVVLDPTRVFVGMPDSYGGTGLTLEEMCKKYDAIGGINAGGFKDDGGGGFGGIPEGLTVIDGKCYNSDFGVTDGFAGLDNSGILHVGYYTYEDCVEKNITNAVSFGPILISNGIPTPEDYFSKGVNPRTAIAQRDDGAILMLVIDGRQVHSVGASYQDVVDLLLDYGAVNACNMDGGSSTTMYFDGKYVNSTSAEGGNPRPLPDAFLIRRK